MVPQYLRARDDAICAVLGRLDPRVGSVLERWSTDSARPFSRVDVLLERGLVSRALYRRALAEVRQEVVAWGPYLGGAEVGRGAHGVVYLAKRGDVSCALKLLRRTGEVDESAWLARLRREGDLLARLAHPGIVRLVEAGERDGTAFVCTEAVLGGSLEEVGTVDPARALAIAEAVGDALSHAHAHGVVHRDVKPSNILLDGDRARVGDFGLAKDLLGDGPTQSRSRLGTLPYSAPEQLVMARSVDGRADVFALAATLHKLLAGEPPYFEARTVGDYFRACARGPAPLRARPGLDAALARALDAILGRALAAEPRRRPSMAELVSAISFLRGELEGVVA